MCVVGEIFTYLEYKGGVESPVGDKHSWGNFKCLLCGNIVKKRLTSVLGGLTKSCGKHREAYPSIKDNNTRHYKQNQDLFKDDKILGYICGLLATDGNVNAANRSLEVCLKIDDFATVEFFANSLVKNPNLSFKKDRNQVGFAGTHHNLYDYCLNMGITPAKSCALDVKLDDKSGEFKRYFLRGVIDGDGCVYPGKEFSRNKIVIYSSSPFLLPNLLDKCIPSTKYFYSSQDNRGKPLTIRGKTYYGKSVMNRADIGGPDAKWLASYLPVDDFTMKRKTEKLLILRESTPKNNTKRFRELFGLPEEQSSTWSIKEYAK